MELDTAYIYGNRLVFKALIKWETVSIMPYALSKFPLGTC